MTLAAYAGLAKDTNGYNDFIKDAIAWLLSRVRCCRRRSRLSEFFFRTIDKFLRRGSELLHQRSDEPTESVRHGLARANALGVFPRHFLHQSERVPALRPLSLRKEGTSGSVPRSVNRSRRRHRSKQSAVSS